MEIRNPQKIVLKLKLFVKRNIIAENVTDEKNKDPIAPERVFFGLIFVSLGPLNILPTIYPPISDATHENKIEYKNIFVKKSVEKIKNKKQITKIYKINNILEVTIIDLFLKILFKIFANSIIEYIPIIIRV